MGHRLTGGGTGAPAPPGAGPRGDPSVGPEPAGPGRAKLAPLVAERIVDDVVARGWPVGEVLGSEAELVARYGVSRAVLREALRLVEHQHVARTRRGPGGGLVVTEPTVDAITDATVLYLHRVGARLDAVLEARVVIEELVALLAPERLDEGDLERLRRLVSRERDGTAFDPRAAHALLAAATKNPALELFVGLLHEVTLLHVTDRRPPAPETLRDAARAHARIIDAVIGGDPGLARRRMRRHLDAEAQFLRGRHLLRDVLDPVTAVRARATGGKRAEAVARAIFAGMVDAGAAPGTPLGSEAELMARHSVSRAVVREAVRLLEHHDLAAMRRGPGGGLYATAPGPAGVTDVLALYLERHGIRGAHVFELRSGVELAAVDLAVDQLDGAGRARLDAALDAERVATDVRFAEVAHDVHAVIASLSGNPVLELLAVVLIRLSRRLAPRARSPRTRRHIEAEVHRSHRAIVAAVAGGDRQLARHRLLRHLQALEPFYR